MNRTEIEAKISQYADKLTGLTKPEDKRVKKRVLQALGKLKKDLALLTSSSAPLRPALAPTTNGRNKEEVDEESSRRGKQKKRSLVDVMVVRGTEGKLDVDTKRVKLDVIPEHSKGTVMQRDDDEIESDSDTEEGSEDENGESLEQDAGVPPTSTEMDTSAPCLALTNKQMKMKLKLLNAELSELAQKKQLKNAMRKFNAFIKKGFTPDIHTYANLLNAHVRCSDLAGALQLYQDMLASTNLAPNVVVLTTLLKGYCEAGDISGATALLFKVMIPAAGQGIQVSTRVLNSYLRGCGRVGEVKYALAAWRALTTVPIPAVDTALVNSQASSTTTPLIETTTPLQDDGDKKIKKKNKSQAATATTPSSTPSCMPDSSSFEYVMALLCQAMHSSAALNLVAQIASGTTTTLTAPTATPSGAKKNSSSSSSSSHAIVAGIVQNHTTTGAGGVGAMENAAVYVCLAKALALQGRWAEANSWIECAIFTIERSRSSSLLQAMQRHAHDDASLEDSKAVGTGTGTGTALTGKGIGKGKGKGKGKSNGEGRSVELFLEHRRSELMDEIETINIFVQSNRTGGSSTAGPATGSDDALAAANTDRQLLNLINSISRLLYFGCDGMSDEVQNIDLQGSQLGLSVPPQALRSASASASSTYQVRDVMQHLKQAMEDKFGLSRVADSLFHRLTALDSQQILDAVDEKLARVVDSSTGFIHFPSLFHSLEGLLSTEMRPDSLFDSREHLETLPVKMEICSGSGEWVTAQAAADPKSLWIALELRCDRVYDTLCRSQFVVPAETPVSRTSFTQRAAASKAAAAKKEVKATSSSGPVKQRAAKYRREQDKHNKRLKYEATLNKTRVDDSGEALDDSSFGLRTSAGEDDECDEIADDSGEHDVDDKDGDHGVGGKGGGRSAAVRAESSDSSQRRRIQNLAYIGGDAALILPHRIAERSVTALFINHPEPPERTGGEGDSEGRHLLTREFFAAMLRVLVPGGTLTIVTDNLPYAQSLCAGLGDTLKKHLMRAGTNGGGSGGGGGGGGGGGRVSAEDVFVSVELDADDEELRRLEEEIVVSGHVHSPSSHVSGALKVGQAAVRTSQIDDRSDSSDSSDSSDDETSAKLPIRVQSSQQLTQPQPQPGITSITQTASRRIQLWRASNPGPEAGHMVASSSYFDRMWSRGQKKRRWFIYLRKESL